MQGRSLVVACEDEQILLEAFEFWVGVDDGLC